MTNFEKMFKFVNTLEKNQMKSNQDFKNQALAALKGNWGKAVLLTLLLFLVASLASGPAAYKSIQLQSYVMEQTGPYSSPASVVSLMSDPTYLGLMKGVYGTSGLMSLLQILIFLPFTVGFANAMKLLLSGNTEVLDNAVTIGFKNKYGRNVLTMLWMQILVFLWSLLFVIPGLIKAVSYSMTPYILHDNPELSPTEAIHRSRMMMQGHKFDYFWLLLSFIGWGVLCVFTAGIGFFWLLPYMETSAAAFYEEVKADYAAHGGLD